MKKYLICLVISPLFAAAQQTPATEKFNLSLGLSLNNSVTTAAATTEYSNRPISSTLFPEAHAVGDLAIFQDVNLVLRCEASLSYGEDKYNLVGTNGYTDYKSAYRISQLAANINPQLLYRFYNTASTKFYGGAGLSISGVSVGVNNSEMASIQGAPYYNSGEAYDAISMTRIGGNLKAGFVTGRLDVYIDYNKALTVSGGGSILGFGVYNPSQTTDQSIYKIGINYRLKLADRKRPERR